MHRYWKFRFIICGLALIVLGIIEARQSTADKREMEKGMMDFNQMQSSDFYSGQFVEGTVYELWDEFAYMEESSSTFGITTSSRVSAHYYVMPLQTSYDSDTPVYVAICLKNSEQISAAEQMVDEMYSYLYGETDEYPSTTISVTGKVSALSGELEQYFYEWFMGDDTSSSRSEYDKYVCPYLITAVMPDSAGNAGFGVALIIIGIILCGVVVFVALKGKAAPQQSEYQAVSNDIPFPEQDSSLMSDMAKLHQPEDNADEFFSRPLKRDKSSDNDNGLGIGIDDEK